MRSRAVSLFTSHAIRYATIIAGGAVWLWSAAQLFSYPIVDVSQVLLLASLSLLAGYRSLAVPTLNLKTGKNSPIVASMTDSLIIFALLIQGAAATIFVAGIAGLSSSRSKTKKLTNNIFSLGLVAFSSAVAVCALRAIIGATGEHGPGLRAPLTSVAITVGIYAFSFFLANTSIMCAFLSSRDNTSLWQSWKQNYLWMAIDFAASASAAALMYASAQKLGLVAFLIGSPIVALIYFVYTLHNRSVQERLRHTEEINKTHLATIEALATAIDAKDQTTSGHVRRTQTYAIEIGKIIGMTEAQIEAVRAAAVLHDVGKIAIPEYILNKPGRLTDEEFAIMKTHVLVGAEILRSVNFPYPVIPAVKHHHERYDGTGYPDGLKGEAIPITARVLSVVDVFDALMQDRPYRKGLPREKVFEMMERDSGTHFDPRIVQVFFANIERLEEMVNSLEPEEEPPAITVDYSSKYPTRREIEPDKLVYSNRVHRDLSTSYRELLSLRTVLEAESMVLEAEDAVAVLLSKLPRIIPHDTAVVYLFSPEKGHLCAEYSAGWNSNALLEREIKPNEGVTGWAFVNSKPLHNTNPAFDLEGAEASLTAQYRGIAAVPLVAGDRVLGVLTVYSRVIDHYTDDHLSLLHKASAAATGIFESREALKTEKTGGIALADAETGIANLEAFEQYWRQEAALSQRSNRPISLLCVSLSPRDSNGELPANTLSIIAQLLRRELRGTDFVGQIDSNSLAAILADIDLGAADFVAERLSQRINESKAVSGQGGWDFEISLMDAMQIEASGINLTEMINHRQRAEVENDIPGAFSPPPIPPAAQADHPNA